MTINLTNLTNVKAWLGITTDADNQLLSQLISSQSRFILSYLVRPSLFKTTYTEQQDGNGGSRIFLKNWPVLSISSLSVSNVAISAASGTGNGYILQNWNGFPPGVAQALTLKGYYFGFGNSNVDITYSAGYTITDEQHTIPTNRTPPLITLTQLYGIAAVVHSVVRDSDDVVFTEVTENPSSAQYSVGDNGQITFNTANANQVVNITYSYIPSDIEQACFEMVAERYRYKDRIGQTSKTLGGQETVAYSISSMSPHVKELLAPYRRVQL